ncbi:MAG: PepSY-associated TM helix domain-containing protein [Burkholderiaceae bacterium]
MGVRRALGRARLGRAGHRRAAAAGRVPARLVVGRPAMSSATPAKARGLRQTMSALHTWTGLLVGWILFAMFLTGSVSYFKDALSQWMRPELPAAATVPDAAEVAPLIVDHLGRVAAGSPQWSFSLPEDRNPVVQAFWRPAGNGGRRFESATFDPRTAQPITSRDTNGGEFFYRFHFNLHYVPVLWGRWIAGFCAMFMLVAIVSGVITHKKIFIDFFTFRWGKGQRSWLDAHNLLSVFGLPFHFMITYSGLVTLMLMYMPWGSDAAFKTPPQRQALTAELSAFVPASPPSRRPAALADVAPMVRDAQQRWGHDNVGRVIVQNPGDAAARVIVTRGSAGRASTSPQYLVFDGVDGKLLDTKDRVGPAAETRGVLVALHEGQFADTTVRWLYFLTSLAGTAMVGTGLVMWTVKRRTRLADPQRPHLGFRIVERLNIAAIAGLPIAMAAFMAGSRLLPLEIAQRKNAEIDLFFIVWAITLLYAIVRPPRRAWIELLWAGAASLALLPVLNAVTSSRGLVTSLAQHDWVFAGIDLTLLALAALLAALALRTMRFKPPLPRTRRPATSRVAGETV